ncbi:MAG: cyclodeaminase/cyclohydrolase family protein [Armatimonadota bacterium]|nr:MAG: cyclodeaminase/cyclohydrolase family protein [Armatimonadota bacterium]
MGYLEEPLRTYTEALASGAPTPGGGSAAALVGALGTALNSMVANFTVGREKFAEVEEEVRGLLAESEGLRAELERLTQADTEAYGKVSAAQKMPRETEGEKAARREAMQEALKAAAEVPRGATKACHRVLEIAAEMVDKGNPNLITDVGVAAKFALAAMECAVLNVEINLAYIKDEGYNAACRQEMAPMVNAGTRLAGEVWDKVNQRVKGGGK